MCSIFISLLKGPVFSLGFRAIVLSLLVEATLQVFIPNHNNIAVT